jgi:hypothetical protein
MKIIEKGHVVARSCDPKIVLRSEIDESIAELQALRRDLRALLKRKLLRPDENEICPLI